MPQFAVYRSPGRDPDVAFVVQIQSSRFDRTLGRVVMALRMVGPRAPRDHDLTPHFTVQGRRVYAEPMDIATVPPRLLGPVLEVLGDNDQDRVIRAVDELISRG
jgi:toxin CcdB